MATDADDSRPAHRPARQLGAAKISMLQDLEQRRPLELAAIVGAVIELADMAGIAVPTIRHVHGLTLGRAARWVSADPPPVQCCVLPRTRSSAASNSGEPGLASSSTTER